MSSGVIGMLSKIGWRKKMLALSGLFILGNMVLAAFGGWTIYSQNNATQAAVSSSQKRVEMATSARVAIVEMERNKAKLIVAQEPRDIRKSAVAAIRGASQLEEAIVNLGKGLRDDKAVLELVALYKLLAPKQT